jgi:hypothetical protein
MLSVIELEGMVKGVGDLTRQAGHAPDGLCRDSFINSGT